MIPVSDAFRDSGPDAGLTSAPARFVVSLLGYLVPTSDPGKPQVGPMSEFDTAWRKWHWAGIHAQQLRECFPGGSTAHPFMDATLTSEYHPKRHCIILRVVTAEPFPAEWSLRLGDVVGNYRAALDHLAWAVVMRGSEAERLSVAAERKVYFPIALDAPDFSRRAKSNLPGVRRVDLAIIRRYQPYQRGARNLERHVLTVLNDCSNVDKHRALQATPALPAASEVTFTSTEDCYITEPGLSRIRTTAIQPGAEVGHVRVRKAGPNPRATCECSLRP